MKRLSLHSSMLMLAGAMVVLARDICFAAPPPPPPPAVPTGDVFSQYAAMGGIAAIGAYRLWKAKRAVKNLGREQ